MRRLEKQRGAALLIVLLLAATLSFIALASMENTSLSAARAVNVNARSEALWRALATETLARKAIETAEAWEIALTSQKTPSVLALSRQGLPTLRTEHRNSNLVTKGAYVLAEAESKRQVILMASGSEVSVAMAAKDILEGQGIGTRVVSVPCMELFLAQDEAYRRKILPAGPVRVAIEAGVRAGGWDRFLLGERGQEKKAGFVGMTGFGASAPAEELFVKFGITAEGTVAKVKELLG